ncbi:MAG: hypothetical protein M3Y87_02220, partial [Myxococcota bacterium]|nr:hypothetical protein [Myxococcota bacterium]
MTLAAITLACGGEVAPEPVPAPMRAMPHAVRLALGATFSCVIDRERHVWCWGELPAEIEGVAPPDRTRRPHEITRMRGAIEIAASATTLCARTADHRVLCWGEDAPAGGDEPRGPREVRGLEGTRSLAVGRNGVCAVRGQALRCIAQNQAPDRGEVPAGATLLSVGGAICAVDGVG